MGTVKGLFPSMCPAASRGGVGYVFSFFPSPDVLARLFCFVHDRMKFPPPPSTFSGMYAPPTIDSNVLDIGWDPLTLSHVEKVAENEIWLLD